MAPGDAASRARFSTVTIARARIQVRLQLELELLLEFVSKFELIAIAIVSKSIRKNGKGRCENSISGDLNTRWAEARRFFLFV